MTVLPITLFGYKASASVPSNMRRTVQNNYDWHLPKQVVTNHEDSDTDEASDVMLADPEVKRPPMYAVVLHNDDYTPMEFVIEVLQTYFGHSVERATEIMLNVHYQGKGIAGVYPRDIAETKAQQVNKQARIAGHPLLCQIEPQGSPD